MLDLSEQELQTVHAILKRCVPDCEVLVFGSRVSKGTKRFSDLDLSIKSDRPLPLNRLAELRMAFEESNLPFRVDIVDWTRTEENFRAIIQKTAQSIYIPEK